MTAWMGDDYDYEHDGIPIVVAPPPGWELFGACRTRDAEFFYVDEHDTQAVSAARRVCAMCPVQMECLDHALSSGERNGVWGGTAERERRAIARNVHGTPERYQARRCRCPFCTAAIGRARERQRLVDQVLAAAREAYGLTV